MIYDLKVGGNDGSLQFEKQFVSSLGLQDAIATFIGVSRTTGASVADVINMAGILGIKACGGPQIPIDFGRIDATAQSIANNLPDLNNNFDAILTFFTNANMNTNDIVALAMGGHTIGGIHIKDFPNIDHGSSPIVDTPDSSQIWPFGK